MDLEIRGVPYEASEYEVTREIAKFLHAQDFGISPEPNERPVNFKVKLSESKLGGVRNGGSGTLTLPSPTLGNKFCRLLRREDQQPIRVDGQKLKFFFSKEHPPPGLAMTLEKTPYVKPEIEEERQLRIQALGDALRIEGIQFGTFYRSWYPKNLTDPPGSRSFSVEWERSYLNKSLGWLKFEYDYKLIRCEVIPPFSSPEFLTLSFECSLEIPPRSKLATTLPSASRALRNWPSVMTAIHVRRILHCPLGVHSYRPCLQSYALTL